jgi:hypothetical protein
MQESDNGLVASASTKICTSGHSIILVFACLGRLKTEIHILYERILSCHGTTVKINLFESPINGAFP